MIDVIVGIILFFIVIIVLATIGSSIRINKEWEESVVLRLGKFNRVMGAGPYLKLPFIEGAIKRDRREQTIDIAQQRVITRDNITVGVDGVMWFKVEDTKRSVLEVQRAFLSVRQLSQTSLRNIAGQKELDELLTQRLQVADEIKEIVDQTARNWGIDITRVELQNIQLPTELQRVMARQAEAEREKRAVIIAAVGELEASEHLKQAADKISKNPIALELRRLSTISDVSQDQSNTIIFAVPMESLATIMAASSGVKVPKPTSR